MSEAIVLLSGGLDSATVLAMAKKQGHEIVALTFDYGQKHRRELESAKKITKHYGVKKHIVMSLDLGKAVRSALTLEEIPVPESRSEAQISSEIPSTYVPSRNIIFLSIAVSIAESRGADRVFIATNSVDFSGYPDCTSEFVSAFQKTIDLGTKAGKTGRGIRVETPLMRMSKADIVRQAVRLGVPLELTWSCYKGGKKACGKCDSCLLRLKGFAEAGFKDPLEYEVSR